MAYIDVDLLKESVLGWNPPLDTEQLKHMIDTIPLADVVEVVRCKDCTNWTSCQTCEEFTTERLPTGGRKTFITAPDFFCGYGQRKVAE